MTIRFTLRQLAIFVEVARHGSATGASKALSMSQSAVSAAIGELELIANDRLFDRHGRRLILNDAGRVLRPHAIALVEGAENLARDLESTVGSLRIATSSTIGNYVLPGILARFLSEQSTVKLRVMIGNSQDVLDAVDAFDADIGLIEGSSQGANMQIEHWMVDEMVIVTAPDHPLARSTRRSDLANADWLLREPGSGTREVLEQQLVSQIGPLKIALELSTLEAIRHTLLDGYGVSCMSRHIVADDLEHGRLVEVEAKLKPIRRSFSIALHRNKAPTRGLMAFRSFLDVQPEGMQAHARVAPKAAAKKASRSR
jgi:DNA-binding transcriptional LysR family regulator